MRLNTLSPAAGSKPSKKRVGRGIGSGLVKQVAVVTKVKNHALAVQFVQVLKAVRCL